MPKVTLSRFNFKTFLKGRIDQTSKRARDQWQRQGQKLAKDLVRETILSGNSPVKGQKRFQKYSKAYSDAIKEGRYGEYGKKLRPVNIKLSGETMKSLSSRKVKTGFSILFKSFLARIHNEEGAGKSKTLRRLLPTGAGEEFKQIIMRPLANLFTKLYRRQAKRK